LLPPVARTLAQREDVELGVVTGPILERFGRARPPEPSHEIAVGVEDARAGAAAAGSPFWRRAWRNRAEGAKTEGEFQRLLSRSGGRSMIECLGEKSSPGKLGAIHNSGAAVVAA
jgi:hypothetical protein